MSYMCVNVSIVSRILLQGWTFQKWGGETRSLDRKFMCWLTGPLASLPRRASLGLFFWRSTQSQLFCGFVWGGVPACCHGPMLPLPSLCPYFDMVHNPPCTPPTICLDVPGDLIGSLLKRAVSVGRVVLVWSCAGLWMVLGWLWWSGSESVFLG